MSKFFIVVAAVAVALIGITPALANVQAVAVEQACVECVPQQVVVQAQPVVQCVQPVAVQTVAVQQVQAYQAVTKSKRPGLLNRIRAFRNAPRRQVTELQPVTAVAPTVAVQAAPCVGISR